jgi:hypothetical protein
LTRGIIIFFIMLMTSIRNKIDKLFFNYNFVSDLIKKN